MSEPERPCTNLPTASEGVKKATTNPTGARQEETASQKPEEIGGPKGPEPTRYGDWEQKGRCTDF
ncbi:DUF1674 domain-containing protein [Varunaivibrio sulfuroxidans]|uniref:DUF1674 domain-containing protein n=1 Tax=Varunaivibrio sulfuroxidans TaxID=1773489 RepID=UPI001FB390B4|nr:DUF1674 domain-containing protein [Varunaivibrio sulfuroxidans]WES29877.1 DUF1674 domain-containing protein [Varunaivibrio sulfuroxidans]